MAEFELLARQLIQRWKEDPNATYQSWFLWDERIKNFRSIRRGLAQVVAEIEAGRFGVAYRGSSLETVVHSVAEQRQIFKGADHAFLWKPKLRIPDIYENPANQRAFGRLLDHCACCDTAEEIIAGIHTIDRLNIKGLGPAVANLLYFLHPTLVPPFNTAIVNGYNKLTGGKVKLGSWQHFLAMRSGVLDLNERFRDLLSNDLGAIGGLLFDIGSGRYPAPPRDEEDQTLRSWAARLEQARAEAQTLNKALQKQGESDRTHSEIQAWLRDIGLALGYDIWIASNDRGRLHDGVRLGEGCLESLPTSISTSTGADAIRLIDVLWLEQGGDRVAAAFEVEHSTSIYSGIVRMLDLALSGSDLHATAGLFLVAPDARESEVRAQIARPAFNRIADLEIAYLPYGELERHKEAISRFGSGLKAIKAISRALP
ncbi:MULTISPECIES: type II restriction endonuclease [Alphaproteobacteria]|uniref:Type II restriction endonuclease n=1 Tax=Sphingobium limneticum TaxID=1007511 RepID=A0A5J5HSL6_9SPHN|nr:MULTISPECIES: type II restriction endonuclease [Alphaproteobacteria]OHD05961.1 MAG: type II restriction endonuclease [Sphingomonadales bacterium GWF1_63_6]KAA9011675.1 type II restriction endonuclease [Sphingobium limneticum]KAA9024259.1 type II restriction endonuclease [Sphingobium limneticum]MBN9146154.1 type II restriction endonuclease [Novosphingobium sp.]ODU80907.1 MAG: type II restriction endonuclease [Novosphingobium sp. SCN 63-17]